MTFVRSRARILEISTTSGSGPLALDGAADGSYNTFASFMSVGDTTYVTVVEPGVAFWSGIATYSAANEITLTTVEETKGTFGAGTKEVMASPLASSSMLREDISGAIVTGGTSTAYTVASYREYDTLARLDGNVVAFTPHATNTAGSPNVTLNVDGLGAKSIQPKPGVDIPAGVLIAGTPYLVLYNHADGVFYLQNSFFGNPYNIPIGGMIDFTGPTAPNSSFVLPFGQAISRTVYAAYFAMVGTTYGGGDGSTTFNILDARGRVIAGKDDMGGSAASRLSAGFFADPTTLGGAGGSETRTLVTANLPPYTPAGTNGPVTVQANRSDVNVSSAATGAGGGDNTYGAQVQLTSTGSGPTFTGTPQGGTSNAFGIIQPTIIANKLLRII